MDIVALITNTTFINNAILVLFFIGFLIIFFRESHNPKSPLVWIDMLLDTKTKKLSLTRFGQFFGIAVSTWVVITLSMKDEWSSAYPLVFGMYLAYIGGTYSFNKYIDNTSKPKDNNNSNTSG